MTEVINHTKSIFASYPTMGHSTAYAQFAKEYGFSHVTRKWRGGTGSEDGEEPTEEARRSIPGSTCTQSHPLTVWLQSIGTVDGSETAYHTRKCLAPGIPDSDRVRERETANRNPDRSGTATTATGLTPFLPLNRAAEYGFPTGTPRQKWWNCTTHSRIWSRPQRHVSEEQKSLATSASPRGR